jgi:hypothetical protein
MNYGALRPGIDTELIDGWMSDRYSHVILDMPNWKRLETDSIVQVPQSYAAGSINATQGSAAVTGVGTVWTSQMSGRMIRINNGPEFYTFTYVSGTSGTLDRAYEAPTVAAVSYRIDQRYFNLNARTREIRGIFPLHDRLRALSFVPPQELNDLDPQRNNYGTPFYWSSAWDEYGQTDPILRFELYPIPDSPDSTGNTLSFIADHVDDAAELTGATTQSLLSWVSPRAMKEGVAADVALFLEKIAIAREHEKYFQDEMQAMAMTNALQRGPTPMRLANDYKGNRPPRYPYGPVRRGFTG